MSDEFVSLDGRMIRVRSCTERHGVWIEMWWPKKADHHKDPVERAIDGVFQQDSDDDEPDQCIFIPGDIKGGVGQAVIDETCDVSVEDDYQMASEDD